MWRSSQYGRGRLRAARIGRRIAASPHPLHEYLECRSLRISAQSAGEVRAERRQQRNSPIAEPDMHHRLTIGAAAVAVLMTFAAAPGTSAEMKYPDLDSQWRNPLSVGFGNPWDT